MSVVIVPAEKIRQGALTATADKRAKVVLCLSSLEKCHSDEAELETILVERGKPHEQVTQTMVGALHAENELSMGAGLMPGDR